MEKGEFEALVAKRESTKLDFKLKVDFSTERNRFEFAKDVSAMANTAGGTGYLLIGVDNQHKPVGIDPRTFDSAQMQQVIQSRCRPKVPFAPELLEYEGRHFVVLTIPESKTKPHRVVDGSKQTVFVRRGDTTDVASPDEIIAMHEESQEAREAQEDSLQYLKSPASAVYFLSVLASCYSIARPVTYFLGFSARQFFDFYSLIIGFCGFVAMTAYGYFGLKQEVEVYSTWRRISVLAVASLGLAAAAAGTIRGSAFVSYPIAFRNPVLSFWDGFLYLTVFSFGLSGLSFLIVEFALPVYLSRMKELDLLNTLRIDVNPSSFPKFKPLLSLVRNRKTVGIAASLLVASAAAPPIDANFLLFTPRITYATPATYLRNSQTLISVGYMLNLTGSFSSNVTSSEGRCQASYYEPRHQNVTIGMPYFSSYAVENVNVSSPSPFATQNITTTNSALFNEGPGATWQYLSVLKPNAVRISIVHSNQTIKSLEVWLANLPRSSVVTVGMSYYVSATPSVQCDEKTTRILSRGGDVVTEYFRHDFLVHNNDSYQVMLQLISLKDIIAFGRNQTAPSIRLNGTELAYVNRQNYQFFYPSIELNPHHELNYSISWTTTF